MKGRPEEKPGVYFISCGGWVKIGYSKNLRRRVAQHISSLPPPGKLVAVIYSQRPKRLEKKIHEELSYIRGKGEWFQTGEDDMARWVGQFAASSTKCSHVVYFDEMEG